MPQELDLNDMLARASISIGPEETSDERKARLRKESRDHLLDHIRSMTVFVVIVLALVFVGALCAYEGVFDPAASGDTKRWAQTTLSALFTGAVSFVLGQMTAKKVK